MKSESRKSFATLVVLLIIITSGCMDSNISSNPESAIEAYYNALISKEREMLTNFSCKDWEANSQTELDSFTAVTATLEDFSCKEAGSDGENVFITCSGKIVANYGDEILDIDMSDRTYISKYEAGEWRMCGYR